MGESGIGNGPRVTLSASAFLPCLIGCGAPPTANGAVSPVMGANLSDEALTRCRRKKKITTAAMVIIAKPPTIPATIKPVFGLLALEGDGVGEELAAVINTPGDISGLSKKM